MKLKDRSEGRRASATAVGVIAYTSKGGDPDSSGCTELVEGGVRCSKSMIHDRCRVRYWFHLAGTSEVTTCRQ